MKMYCSVCKAFVSVAPQRGEVVQVGIEHEDWCSFLKAYEMGGATLKSYIGKHGYPIVVSDGKELN